MCMGYLNPQHFDKYSLDVISLFVVLIVTLQLNETDQVLSPHITVFLSSTFCDTQHERNYLLEYAASAISDWCREFNLDFAFVDMYVLSVVYLKCMNTSMSSTECL